MRGRDSIKQELSKQEHMRAPRRRRGLGKLAALVAVCALAVVVVTTVFAARSTHASGAVSPAPASIVQASSTTLPASSAPTTTSTAPTITSPTPLTALAAPTTTTATVYVHAIPDPARIVIPGIDVDAKVIHVGLRQNGDMEVPSFGLAGWYELGPAPGAGGPAVIVAHVDSNKGPDVFYRLKELEPGDEVTVYGRDGDAATFVVDSKEQQLKSELPSDRIWNDTWEPVIRLITCGGDFDRAWGHYLANVVVYGHLVR